MELIRNFTLSIKLHYPIKLEIVVTVPLEKKSFEWPNFHVSQSQCHCAFV